MESNQDLQCNLQKNFRAIWYELKIVTSRKLNSSYEKDVW